MKKFLVLSAIVGAFGLTSCASCDETKAAEDFSAATTAYSTAIMSMDCAAINTAWGNYSDAYNNLCDSQKSNTDWAALEAAHNSTKTSLGC
jgi:hypothetical protein